MAVVWEVEDGEQVLKCPSLPERGQGAGMGLPGGSTRKRGEQEGRRRRMGDQEESSPSAEPGNISHGTALCKLPLLAPEAPKTES